MSEPNLLAPASLKGKTKYVYGPSSSPLEIISNPVGSNKIFKINAVSVIYDEITEGEKPIGLILIDSTQGNNFKFDRISYTFMHSSTASGRYKIINKNEMIYLQEGDKLKYAVEKGSSANVYFTTSYEEIN